MTRNERQVSADGIIITILIFMNAIILKAAYTENEKYYWVLLLSVPVLLIALQDMYLKKDAVKRNTPLYVRLRYFFGSIGSLICERFKSTRVVDRQNPALYKGQEPFSKDIQADDFNTNALITAKKVINPFAFRRNQKHSDKKVFGRINGPESKSDEQIDLRKKAMRLNHFQ